MKDVDDLVPIHNKKRCLALSHWVTWKDDTVFVGTD